MLLLVIELALSVVLILLAFIAPRLGCSWFSAVERRVGPFAANRRAAVLTILFLALGARIAVLPVEPIPHPGVHDEFSHLLIADTLAHGRLANPTPPMWEHFETFHENFTPMYASMYYPGQGIFLALGQVVFGHPFWGVWLSSGLMCAAFCWALQGWMPSGWAFLGGILAIIRLGTFSYWDNGYWGGAVGALGGALVIGAMPRIAETHRTRDAVLMALGFALIVNTRPFEGLFFCFPIVVGLLMFLALRVRGHWVWIRRVALPMCVVLVITMGLMAFYFYKTTGDPLTIPYKPNIQRYGYTYFPWQPFKTNVTFRHAAMRDFYEGELRGAWQRSRREPLTLFVFRALDMWSFFCGPLLMVPLWFLIPAAPPDVRLRSVNWQIWVLITAFVMSMVSLFLPSLFLNTHYAAPITPAFYALLLLAFERVYSWKPWSRPVGKLLVRTVPLGAVTLALIYILVPSSRPSNVMLIPTWCTAWHPIDRATVEHQLNGAGGQHLVIVRYSAQHEPGQEWVFNAADIDSSRIIWARDMGPEENRQLLNYYRNRKVWLLQPDCNPPKLTPYIEDGLTSTTKAAVGISLRGSARLSQANLETIVMSAGP